MPASAILCVDDQAVIAFSLKQELRRRYAERFIYETALTGEDALEIGAALKDRGLQLALVITDWLMPGMRGETLIRTIRGQHPKVRTLIVTGQSDDAHIDDLVSSGMVSGVILKPWTSLSLFGSIDSCLREFLLDDAIHGPEDL